jgi:two-component system chemotaxis response regulator CheY
MRALVVDDSRAMRRIIREILDELDFDVEEAADGKQALAQLAEMEVPELALVDWNMPEMNGYELLCALRADPRYHDLRFMMVTTETEVSQVAKALEAGANEYLMKPFTKEMLIAKLELLGYAD